MKFAATCLFGLEKLLGEEIDALGLKRDKTIDGRVIFDGDVSDIPRLNINLRYAERVYIVLGEFQARTFTELFDGTRALRFYDYIGEKDAFPVKGHSIKSALTSIPDCQSIVKKAAVESMKDRYHVQRFEETGTTYQIEFFILKD
ncbi:MAG: class I SAM-dependent RNA methyltransferase, partial [Clostridia bacterium]|nr:class I SAM-dependent RNA methyltransferase [Clostridia bacterium]